jgi:hypothetical protein
MLSVLDPPGLPVAIQIVSGERADDLLSRPAIAQVSQSPDTRACVQVQQDFYVCPLAAKRLPGEVLEAYLRPVCVGEQA